MQVPAIPQDTLNLFNKLAYGIRDVILRRQEAIAGKTSRNDWVYDRAQERFDYITQGEDLINLAPVRVGEPLVNVEPEHHEKLRELGAVEKDGQFFMPNLLDDERWVFKNWFPKAPPDLVSMDLNWHLTRDGRPTNGYIHPEDLVRGNDSTATSFLMAAFPVLFAGGYAMSQVPIVGPGMALAVTGPLLALHAYALYQAEGAGTLAKVLALSGGVPLMAAGLSGDVPFQVSGKAMLIGGVTIGAIIAFAKALASSGKSPAVSSLFSKAAHVLMVIGTLFGMNYALGLLPPSLNWVKPLSWFVVACAYPLYYTAGNHNARTAFFDLMTKRGAGSVHGSATMLGKTSSFRMQQIRSAFRDKSPFLTLGTALGVQARYNLSLAPDPGQVMGMTVEDLKTHLFLFGKTGKGKTQAIRKLMLELAQLGMPIGALVADGKWALVADTRAWYDLVIEPGIKFAPFQGLTSLTLTQAFAEANNASMEDEGSIWVQVAGQAHRYGSAILEALVAHEKVRRAADQRELEAVELRIERLVAQKILLERSHADLSAVNARLEAESKLVRTLMAKLKGGRVYRWAPAAYSKIINTLGSGVKGTDGVWRPSDKAMALFDYLGFRAKKDGEDDALFNQRVELEPESIHPHLADESRVLSNAIYFFTVPWFQGKTEEQRQSFLMNIDKDLQGFMQNDELRGSTIGGLDCGDEAWSHTEEGEDVLQCLNGKKVGLNLSDRYGKTAKVIQKLIEKRVFDAARERNERYGDEWPEKTGQSYVVVIKDECQDLVSPADVKMVAVGRSMGVQMVYATQNYESLDTILPSDDAKGAFLYNFRSRIIFEASPKTYDYIQRDAGVTMKRKLTVSVQETVDTSRTVDMIYASAYTDRNHPSAWRFRDMARRGSTRLQVVIQGLKNYMGLARRVPVEELQEQNYFPVYSSGKYEEGPIIEKTDLAGNLMEESNALLYINRAGHPRIDFAKMEYIGTKDFGRRMKAIQAAKAAALNEMH